MTVPSETSLTSDQHSLHIQRFARHGTTTTTTTIKSRISESSGERISMAHPLSGGPSSGSPTISVSPTESISVSTPSHMHPNFIESFGTTPSPDTSHDSEGTVSAGFGSGSGSGSYPAAAETAARRDLVDQYHPMGHRVDPAALVPQPCLSLTRSAFDQHPPEIKIKRLLDENMFLHIKIGQLSEQCQRSEQQRKHMEDDIEKLSMELFQEAYRRMDEIRIALEQEMASHSGTKVQLRSTTSRLEELQQLLEVAELERVYLKEAIWRRVESTQELANADAAVAAVVHQPPVVPSSMPPYLLANHQQDYADFIGYLASSRNVRFLAKCQEFDIEPCLRYAMPTVVDRRRVQRLVAAIMQTTLLVETVRFPSHPIRDLDNDDANRSRLSIRMSAWFRFSKHADANDSLCYLCDQSNKTATHRQGTTGAAATTSATTSTTTTFRLFHRFRFEDQDPTWKYLCAGCHARVVACCTLCHFLRTCVLGVYHWRTRKQQAYQQCLQYRMQLFQLRMS